MKVEIPEIMPGVVTGFIMAFTLSLDDFVISYFTSGNGFETLPIRIYSMTKKTVTPKMYALATIIFFVILALLILTNLVDDDSRARRPRPARGAYSAPPPGSSAAFWLPPAGIAVLILSGSGTQDLLTPITGAEISPTGPTTHSTP